jgi:hypothetical protein
MPITDAIILSLIVFAFLTFAVVLAWGDFQTKEIARKSRDRALFSSDPHVVTPEQSVEAEKGEQVASDQSREWHRCRLHRPTSLLSR